MANKMLIDAAHPEETRVVVLRGNRVEEFDHESLNRRQLRGNIYLAKVTRVEPSLQAAFVDFGGNRHGFLAFSEIHPDYYQIPVADRQALLEEEAAEASRAEAKEAADDEEAEETVGDASSDDPSDFADDDNSLPEEISASPEPSDIESEEGTQENAANADTDASADGASEDPRAAPREMALASDTKSPVIASANEAAPSIVDERNDDNSNISDKSDETAETLASGDTHDHDEHDNSDGPANALDENDTANNADEDVESVGSEDVMEEMPQRVRRRRRIYKIQEVIKRRQIILVQVVKEERGTKGAALTTYLSLAGRYTVLMPNTARGGGISRKITNHTDRRRLRKIANELEVPEGMGLIIRTAGASRTKAEIKRDFEYLLRLWENVRDLTLESTAPSLVYEEGSLIKRSIRDLYSKEIDEVLVAGDEAYREAKDFMRMLMPSHAKNVQPYKDPDPLFVRHRIERQLNSMFSPYVTLRSGGYIVINQTEALVSVDVNSGKATKEHSIEDTALKTNLEAADEIARQLRLRDLAGLIVIDFIDMDEKRNNRAVERKMKDCLRNDRARIQIGRISHFGLLEMSRQRLRTGVLEGSTVQCPHCQGTGMLRSTESVALTILRALEDALLTGPACDLSVTASIEIALYILNQKRPYLKDIEARYNADIAVRADESLHGANFSVERIARSGDDGSEAASVVQMDWAHHDRTPAAPPQEGQDAEKKRSRRRRGRGKGRSGSSDAAAPTSQFESQDTEAAEESGNPSTSPARDENSKRGRRRGRRGGRRNRSSAPRENLEAANPDHEGSAETNDSDAASMQQTSSEAESASAPSQTSQGYEGTTPEQPEPVRDRLETTSKDAETAQPDMALKSDMPAEPPAAEPEAAPKFESEAESGTDADAQTGEKPKPVRRRRRKPEAKTESDSAAVAPQDAEPKTKSDPAPANVSNGTEKPTPASESVTAEPAIVPTVVEEKPAKPRGGWWQRKTP